MNTLVLTAAVRLANRQVSALEQEFPGLGSNRSTGVAAQADSARTPAVGRVTLSRYVVTVEQNEDPFSASMAPEPDDGENETVSLGQFGIELTFETPDSDAPTTQAAPAPTADAAASAAYMHANGKNALNVNDL